MPVGWACFRNYVAHAEEIGGETTEYPRFFIMPESSHIHSDLSGKNMIKLMNDSDHIQTPFRASNTYVIVLNLI